MAPGSDEVIELAGPAELRIKLDRPAYVYPMFEQSLRIAAGETSEDHRRRIGELWSQFSAVAATNPYAWSREPLSGKQINVSVEASKVAATGRGEVWLCSVSRAVPISIGRGENRGQQITYYNVVRNLVKVGDWNGGAGNWTIPLENISSDGVDAAVVYVQDGSRDKPGAMLGAAYTSLR